MFNPIPHDQLKSKGHIIRNWKHSYAERQHVLASAALDQMTESRSRKLSREEAGELKLCLNSLGNYVAYKGKPSGDPAARETALNYLADLGLLDEVAKFAANPHPEVHQPALDVLHRMMKSMGPNSTRSREESKRWARALKIIHKAYVPKPGRA